MSETKYTKGPWSVNRKVKRFVDAGPDGDGLITICDCDPIDEMPSKQAQANARLIASAPELLEVLQTFGGVGAGFCCCPLDKPDAPEEAHSTQCQMARKAIAQATGKGE